MTTFPEELLPSTYMKASFICNKIEVRIRLWCLMPLSTIILWRSVLLVEETRVPGENH